MRHMSRRPAEAAGGRGRAETAEIGEAGELAGRVAIVTGACLVVDGGWTMV